MTIALEPGNPSRSPLRHSTYAQLDRSYPIDYHNHTTWTDGTAASRDMAVAAAHAGIREILFSEHIRSTSSYFAGFAAEIRAIDIAGLKVFVGVEAKILDLNGTLDAPSAIEDMCDAIVGSVHSPPNSDGTSGSWGDFTPEQALNTELALALAIVQKSRAHIIGHPLGMVITKFDLEPREELLMIARACTESGKAFELNPRYCLDPKIMIDIATTADCKVNIGSDAHFTNAVGSSWRKFVTGVQGVSVSPEGSAA